MMRIYGDENAYVMDVEEKRKKKEKHRRYDSLVHKGINYAPLGCSPCFFLNCVIL